MTDETAAEPLQRRRPRWVRTTVMVVLVLAAVEYGVLPSLVAARHDVDLIRSASLVLLGAALLLEAASLVCYTGLTRAVLPVDTHLGWGTQLAIDLTGYGVSHVVPGGGATAMGLRYRLMAAAGVPRPTVVTATATQTVLSDLFLAACYLVGALVAFPEVLQHRSLQIAAAAGVGFFLLVGIAAAVIVRSHPHWSDPIEQAGTRLGQWLQPRLATAGTQLVAFLVDRRRTARAAGFGMANWLLDATCLYVCLAAYSDHRLAPEVVLTAYGFANLLGLLPLTPGGLGLVEGSLIPLLIALGSPTDAAVLGVLTWRVFQFWLPVPVSACCYLWLRLTGRTRPRPDTGVKDASGSAPGASGTR
ncbi:MAG: YbhN family protein [Nocardioides sp.]